MRLLEHYRRWMVGRYGSDQLNIGLLGAYVICNIITGFTRSVTLGILSYGILAVLFYRMFSKNIAKRYEENQKFLRITAPIRATAIRKVHQAQRQSSDKAHKYYVCKGCKQMIRVPRGKGRIAITCPRCRQEFVKRT